VTVKGFNKFCIFNAMNETDDMLWNDSEEDGNVRSECEKMQALTVKIETVTLIGKGRQYLTCFEYEVYEIIGKIFFFLADFYFWGVVLHSGKYSISLPKKQLPGH
jgi:hypothetical protein